MTEHPDSDSGSDSGSDFDSGHGHRHGHEAEISEPLERWTSDFWDERYRSSPSLWSGHVNAVVRTETANLSPGRALDVGCGEGGDALWLASRGWHVDAVDVSRVAIERAAEQARASGEEVAHRLTWAQRDILEWAPPERTYDLVYLSFLHLPSRNRTPVHRALADAVSPGGSFLVVAHHPDDVGVVPRPPEPDLFFTPEELADELAEDTWEVVTAEARPRVSTHPDGHEVTVHDTVLRAVRRA